MSLPTPAQRRHERLVRFQELVVQQGTYIRSFAEYPEIRDDADANATSEARLRELADLGELLRDGGEQSWFDPDEAIRRWVHANPLVATGDTLRRRLDARDAEPVAEGVYRADLRVRVKIGDGHDAPGFTVLAKDVGVDGYLAHLDLRLPESVAEQFRQQGRRQLRRELSALLGYDVPG